ncbi:MAG: DUF1731 domain-containing protein, partial [Bryobacteraceae bacterium]
GRQWMSWIHIDDLVGLIRLAIDQPLSGPVNGASPSPVTNSEFTKTLGSVLGRPTLFPVPGFGLKILLGEMSEVVLDSQKVQPEAARRAGYQFRFERLSDALRDILTPAAARTER